MSWHDTFRLWLSESQSLQNAQKVVNHLYRDNSDWSKESIAALIGNMRVESSVNPNIYEYGYNWNQDRGYGLVQWTPRSKFWDWAVDMELDPEKGESQLARIDFEVDNNIQWIPRQSIGNMTFKEFRTNSGGWSVDYLTAAFTWGYERPKQADGEKSMPIRVAFAKRALNELTWEKSGEPTPQPTPEPNPPSLDFSEITDKFNSFGESLVKKIEELLTIDMYNYSNSQKTFGNNFLTVTKQMGNMYKIRPTINMGDILKDIIKESSDGLNDIIEGLEPVIPPLPQPEPDEYPKPESERCFPVDFNASGINFWFPPHDNNLTNDMDYGVRSSGKWHAGYDIGGGGKSHKIYAVESGEVVTAKYQNISGNLVVIKHDNDDYYSLYQHLQNGFLVSVGDKVVSGQHIGNMGNSGGNYAIHLHYELSKTNEWWVKGVTDNPKNYLGVYADNKTKLKNPIS